MQHKTTAIDKLAMGLSAALMLVSIVVLGVVEILAGAPYSPVPLTNDAGEVIATPLIGPNLRTGLFMLGLVVLLLWGIYKMVSPQIAPGGSATTELTAD